MPNAPIGKVALVTGGSRGIGAAVVRRPASDGATVAFSYAASGDRAKALASLGRCIDSAVAGTVEILNCND
jgi:3-oxoacyl-[acyl-carrier protein] reductase